ncbi:MAG: aldehyde ferredoxin oxidoreductase C-terminal domain-containing protein [Candidatus Thermoplasmatota archaeon]|nr:aldehyde ferredoxin oxidoreductase C-terminal domain-containing protein [Candidatus Thermoplasmatota archaeon]
MVLSEMKYNVPKVEKGYAGQTLYVNVGTGEIKAKPVDQKMKDTFTGGKGFDLWLMWNALPKDRAIKWDEPENEICISGGPLAGTTVYPGSGKSIVTAISPLTGIPVDCNVGGYFGPFLKFSGWDALEVQGKAKNECIIVIDGDAGSVKIEDGAGLPSESHLVAEILTERYGKENRATVSVVSAGPGAEHTLMGCLNFSWYDPKSGYVRYKQAGRGGTGTVFRNKKVKAMVCKYSGQVSGANHPADEKALAEVGRQHTTEILELDPKQNEMRQIGTAHLPPIMNQFDLLPTKNFQYGSHPDAKNIDNEVFRSLYTHGRNDGCWKGCSVACAHGVDNHVLKSGPWKGKKVPVDGPEYETIAGCGSNLGIFDPHWIIEYNFYCDTYGIDTISFGTGLAFVMECYERGLIDKKATGGLDLKFGNAEAAAEVLHQMAKGEGFGVVVGQGIHKMKEIFAKKYGADPKLMQDIGMEMKGLEYSEYVTKESLAQQGGYGMALKGPQHDEAWLIFIDMVRNQIPTFEQKAEALHWFPMWRTWFGLNGLCKLPWNDIVPEDNNRDKEPAKVMKHVTWYSKFFSAVTGKKSEPDDLIKMSERVYNFQRIFNLRMGKGTRQFDEPVPYRSMGPVTKEEYESRAERYDKQLKEKIGIDSAGKTTEEKMKITRKFREEQYHKLVDAAYQRRGWTNNGVPTLAKINELGIDFPDVVELVKKNQ